MMKKAVLILACVTIAMLVAIGSVLAQEKTGVVGTWTGYSIVGDGSRLDFVFTVAKGEEGLTAKITDETGMMPEIVGRNVVFADSKLSLDIDYPNGMEFVLIKISLTLDGDSLKGFWNDPDGSSDIIELVRKK
jgi:hypothetical protein